MLNDNKKTDDFNFCDKKVAASLAYEVLLKMEQNPGMTLKDATGISDKVLEEIYSLAFNFYNQAKYGEALALFQFLSGASPSTYKYVLGLAACCHQMQSYEQAAIGFFAALNIESNSPFAAYYLTDCFLKQNILVEALECAELTVMICDNKPEYSALKQRCELIIDSIKCNKIS